METRPAPGESQLAWIVNDVEDIIAERMERALRDGWGPWHDYIPRSTHRELRLSEHKLPHIQVRVRYEGQIKAELEVKFGTRTGAMHVYPEATEWFFEGVEDEAEVRATREPNDKPLKPY